MSVRPLLLLLLALVAGCDAADPAPRLGGLYVHTEGGGIAVFRMDLPETAGGAFALGPASEVVFAGEREPMTGTGTYAPPALTVTFTFGGETATMSGPVAADGASFVLDDDEGVSRMTFTRQP